VATVSEPEPCFCQHTAAPRGAAGLSRTGDKRKTRFVVGRVFAAVGIDSSRRRLLRIGQSRLVAVATGEIGLGLSLPTVTAGSGLGLDGHRVNIRDFRPRRGTISESADGPETVSDTSRTRSPQQRYAAGACERHSELRKDPIAPPTDPNANAMSEKSAPPRKNPPTRSQNSLS